MAENKEQQASTDSAIDLSGLQDLNFGPNWDSSSKPATHKNYGEARKPRKGSAGSRNGGDRRPSNDRRPAKDRRPPSAKGRAEEKPFFHPIVDVLFYPDDEAFKVLSKAIRDSYRTYELFEVARAILDKEERFVVVLQPRKDADKNENLPKEFFVSQPDHLPFERQEDALAHVLSKHLEHFFEIEEVEVEPPKGNFPFVNRCGITGVLLGPPNYHRYQQLVQDHHAARLGNMPFERFQSRIEKVSEEETVNEWIESMKTVKRYRLRDRKEDEPEVIESLEGVRLFLLNHRKEETIRKTDQARFSGRIIKEMPQSGLRRSVESALEQQRKFPLDTANNLRGRLRRMNFTIYKRGSKGVSWVCGVKRKFREEGTTFAESLQQLIDFIEHHPNIQISKLPEQFLGLETTEIKTANVEAQTPTQSPRKAIDEEDARKEQTSDTQEVTNDTEEASPPESEQPKAKAEPFTNRTPEEKKQLKQMMSDLHWLVSEGYVTEFGDGKLFTAPPMPAPKKKEASETTSEAEQSTEPKAQPAQEAVEKKEDSPVEVSAAQEAKPEPVSETESAPEEQTPAEEEPKK